jgi:hypothetical protein
MSDSLDQQLNQSLRDAMLAYYLTHKVPDALKATIGNADDLYAYWLLDVQVSQAVPTSPVACAIPACNNTSAVLNWAWSRAMPIRA